MRKRDKFGLLTLGLVVLLVMIRTVQATSTVQGTPQPIGQGTARSYVALKDRKQISDIGILLSESVLSNLPSTMTEVELALPRQAVRATPFTHIGLNWNPQGHPQNSIKHFRTRLLVPPAIQRGNYPSQYSVSYNEEAHEFRINLSHFVS